MVLSAPATRTRRGCSPGLLVFLTHLFHDVDEAFQPKHITHVRSVMHGGVIPEAFERAVCEVNHAHIHLGLRRGTGLRGAAILKALRERAVHPLQAHLRPALHKHPCPAVLPVVNDEKGAGVEAVGGLSLQNRLQASQFGQDRLKEVLAQLDAVVQILVEGIAEALNGKTASIVFIPAQVMPCVQLIDLESQRRNTSSGSNRFRPGRAPCAALHGQGRGTSPCHLHGQAGARNSSACSPNSKAPHGYIPSQHTQGAARHCKGPQEAGHNRPRGSKHQALQQRGQSPGSSSCQHMLLLLWAM